MTKIILVDYSAIGIAAVVSHISRHGELDEGYGLHLILNSVRGITKDLSPIFGEVAICCDSKGNWRKKFFPEYKGARTKAKEESPFDWDLLYSIVNRAKEAMDEHFPCVVLEKPGCEADDLIAAMARSEKGPHCVVSEDHDYNQLMINPELSIFHQRKKQFVLNSMSEQGVKDAVETKYSSNRKFEVTYQSPEWAAEYRIGHMIRGCSGDGVPNCMSDDDTFIDPDKRQTRMTKKQWARLRAGWDKDMDGYTKEEKVNIVRNITMCDLTSCNLDCRKITEVYSAKKDQEINRVDVKNFLLEYKLMSLVAKIKEFFPPDSSAPVGISAFFESYKK